MKTSIALKVVSNLALAILFVALTGCATANYKKSTSASVGLTESADRIALCNVKIDATLAALNDMVNSPQGDLVVKFNTFNKATDDLLSAVKNVTSRVGSLESMGEEYFKEWDKQLGLIQDADIRQRSAQRKVEVEKEFSDIQKGYAEVETAFKPFVIYLQDIQRALGTDLTVGGIASLKGAVETAGMKAQPLKASVDRLVGQFRDLGMAMASSIPVPQAAAPQSQPPPPASGTN